MPIMEELSGFSMAVEEQESLCYLCVQIISYGIPLVGIEIMPLGTKNYYLI
jgi:hypothetical protein